MTTQQQTRRATGRSWLLPPDGSEYPQILHGSGYAWWRSAIGVALALSLLLLLTAIVSQLVVRLAWATSSTGEDYADYAARANDFELPSGLLATNLGISFAVAALTLVGVQVLSLLIRPVDGWVSSKASWASWS